MTAEELIRMMRSDPTWMGKEIADCVEGLTKERDELHDRITAMETGDWSEVRLVRFENGQFDLTAGPIPAIAEYLAQMMEDGKGEYFNFMEVQINHKSAGPMVLSLQRKHGKTPNELRKEAEAKLAKAVEDRDHWSDVADREGVCMTCRGPYGAPDPYGCSDCFNTGYCGEHHNTVYDLEAKLTQAVEALGLADDALYEAEAILGGEYGDQYGPLCEMMVKLRTILADIKSHSKKTITE